MRAPKDPSSSGSRPAGRSPRGGCAWLLGRLAAAVVWMGIVLGLLVAWYATGLPELESAVRVSRRPSITVTAADGTTLATVGDVHGGAVRLEDLPPILPQAVIATEDRRFFEHFGVDPWGLVRALVSNVRARHVVQGGSTITQQVAKNLFLSPERTFRRKVQELLLALKLESRFTKNQILEMYLNRVYLGTGTYGVEAAAQRYFGKPAAALGPYEAAMIAGLLKAPSRYNPLSSRARAEARTSQVLANLVAAGYMTTDQARAAEKTRSGVFAEAPAGIGRYFVDWVLEQVGSYVTPGDRDLVVLTTLDPGLQRQAEEKLALTLDGPGKKAGATEAALVALDGDGAVRAMVGGRDYRQSQFNRATQALRQPGSAFKPIVYLAGLEAGLTPDTMLEDAPITLGGWSPDNYDNRYRGPVTMAEGLAESLNTVSVRVGERAGFKHVVELAHRLGLPEEMKAEATLALGVAEVTPLELTTVYAHFANGGVGVLSYGIESIRDGEGDELYHRQGSGIGQMIEPRFVAALNTMLEGVIDHGTGKAARLERPAAGKTGTTQSYRDAWFVGYSGGLVLSVWFGNDDGTPMRNVTGGGLPAHLWHDVMAAVPADRPRPGEPPPQAPQGGEDTGFWEKVLKPLLGGN